jgi:hypothetical protein
MGAADLDDIVPLGGFGRDRIAQCLDPGNQTLHDIHRGGDVHRRGKRIVRRLRHVDVIVRMHRRLAAERVPASWQQRLEMTSFTFMLN